MLRIIRKVLSFILSFVAVLAILAFAAVELYVWVIYKAPADGQVPLWIEFFKFHFETLVLIA